MKILDYSGLRWGPLWLALGWVWLAYVWYVSLTPHPPELPGLPWADKWGHTAAYALLMGWFGQLVVRRLRVGLLIALVGMGVAIEFVQGTTDYRSFEVADMAADFAGAALAFALLASGRLRLFAAVEAVGSRWLR